MKHRAGKVTLHSLSYPTSHQGVTWTSSRLHRLALYPWYTFTICPALGQMLFIQECESRSSIHHCLYSARTEISLKIFFPGEESNILLHIYILRLKIRTKN
jgi:hypothetical protein